MAQPCLYTCPLCGSPSTTLKLYVSHLRVRHSKDPAFNVFCGVGGCREVFRTFSAFSSHIYRHHRADMSILRSEAPDITRTPTLNLTNSTLVADQLERMEVEEYDDSLEKNDSLLSTLIPGCDDSNHSQFPGTSASVMNATMVAAKLLLRLREGHQVSQVAISEVISGCRLLCNQALDNLKGDVVKALKTSGDEEKQLSLVLNANYDPFENIDTNYLFEKFCVDHLGCLVSL